MPRGQRNLLRQQARDAGLKTYADPDFACWCGCITRYVVNGQCVDCLIARGKARYAAMTAEDREAMKAKDHERYLARLAK